MPNARVKVGDICQIVGDEENNFRLCEVIARSDFTFNGWECRALQVISTWRATPLGHSRVECLSGDTFHAGSEYLRPLHDGDGADESLAWKSVPKPTAKDVPARSIEFAR